MKIASLLNRRVLRPSWTFTPNGIIWRLLPTESGEFVGEARNQEAKKTSFFALNAITGDVLWQDLKLSEDWWVGIEGVSDGVLLLHRFASPDMPQHKGIVAVGLKSGDVLWENADLAFWQIYEGSILASKTMFEKRNIVELDLKTGNIKREHSGENELAELRNRVLRNLNENQGLTFPEILETDSIESPAIRSLRKDLRANDLLGNVEYLIASGFLLTNFHLRSKHSNGGTLSMDNYLRIYDVKTANIVYDEIIAHRSSAPVPDSFFVRDTTVYFIKDQTTLTAIRLG